MDRPRCKEGGDGRLVRVLATAQLSLSLRLDPIPSTSTRYTAYPLRTLRLLIRLQTPLTPILRLFPRQRRMSLRPNVSFAFPHRVRLSFCLVAIWSRAASVPSTWLSSGPEVPSPTLKRNPLRVGIITRTMPRMRTPTRLKRKLREPLLKLNLPKLRPPTEGRGGPRDGSALYADNVRPNTTCPAQ